MAGVSLDDHRAAGRKRRGRVAPGDGEGEGEIAGRKHGNRAKGQQHAPDARPWGGLPFRLGRSMMAST